MAPNLTGPCDIHRSIDFLFGQARNVATSRVHLRLFAARECRLRMAANRIVSDDGQTFSSIDRGDGPGVANRPPDSTPAVSRKTRYRHQRDAEVRVDVLVKCLTSITGYEHGYAACAYGNLEQELYLPRLIDIRGTGVVIQQHFKANAANLELLKAFGMRPVVQVEMF